MNIDFIYFDVGGVVILDYSKTNKWNQMLADLGISETDKSKINVLFDAEESKFCTGEKSAESFVETLRRDFNLNLPKTYSFLSEFISRFEPNPSLAKIIIDLRKKTRIGLLTNMYPNMLDGIKAKGLLPDVTWDVVVDSSVVGLRKPQPEIFKLSQEAAGVSPEKILFVENGIKHIEGAKKAGWNTLLYDPSDIETSNRNLLTILAVDKKS